MRSHIKTKTLKCLPRVYQLPKWVVLQFLLVGWMTTINAQESIISSGGITSGQGGSASFSIGQVTYTAISGQGYSIMQGVQQPYEISVISTSEELTLSGIDIQSENEELKKRMEKIELIIASTTK